MIELSVMRLEADGSPDETFGDHGTTNVSVTARSSPTGDPGLDSGAALALQPDGGIFIAGATGGPYSDFAIARLLTDGTLDTDFTDTGVMTIDFFGSTDPAESVAVTDAGSIVVAGLAHDNADGYGVARLSPQDTQLPTPPARIAVLRSADRARRPEAAAAEPVLIL